MTHTAIYHGIAGILRPFKEYLVEKGLNSGDQVVYYGCVGTCTPFVELLAMAVRGNNYEQVYVPLLDETKAKILHEVPDAGMQISEAAAVLKPRVLVFMGGLAMPYMPVKSSQVNDVIVRHPGVIVAGVCFMSMFKKAGWLESVTFDLLIDGTLDPVTVTRKD